MTYPTHLIPTTVVGSYPQPDWLVDRSTLAHHGVPRVAARDIWRTINRPNLIENILPTRPRATLVLRKDADHSINRLRLRKL